MSVYTKVTERELGGWLKAYSVGTLVELKGIAAGIENTNYFVTTTHGRYVLTLFERLPAKDLPFYLGLMAHLARHGIPCPAPIADLSDQYLQQLNGKPAAVIDGFSGDQRFFMGWSQVWRRKYRDEDLRSRLMTDSHSPSEYRCNGIVTNINEFYRAFDVQPGDKLYRPAEERVEIW